MLSAERKAPSADKVLRDCAGRVIDIVRIFKDRAEPLYGRNTGLFRVQPFKVSVLMDVLSEHSPKYTNDRKDLGRPKEPPQVNKVLYRPSASPWPRDPVPRVWTEGRPRRT